MSYQDEIDRIEAARDTIRAKLASMGLVSATCGLDECAAAMANLVPAIGSCTVKFTGGCKLYNIGYMQMVDGEPVAKTVYAAGATSYTLNDVAAKSLIVVGINAHGTITVGSGASNLGVLFSTSNAFRINTTAGATVTITIAAA